jgi:hypothetical protein
MMKRFSATTLILMMGFSIQANADLLDLNISNDAVAGQYLVDMGQGFFAGGGVLHEEDAGQVVSLDFMVRDDLRSGEYLFTAGVGGRLLGIFTEQDGNDGGSLALGGFMAYKIPTMKALAIRGEVYYGPSVTSIDDIDGVIIYSLAAEIEVIERAILHAGYRKVEVDFGPVSGDMDEGMNVGFKLEF